MLGLVATGGVATLHSTVCAAAPTEGTSPGSSGAAGSIKPEDLTFLNYAAEDNQAEIHLCLMAEKLAQSFAVKAFARLMVNDHVQIESRLAMLVNKLGVTVPNGIGKEGGETQARLEKLEGASFDRAFMQAQVEDHTGDLKKFHHEIKSTDNPGIRNFSSETVGILQQHLELAKLVLAGIEGQTS